MAPVVEAAYWRIVEHGEQELWVEYGNDQDTRAVGSGFAGREVFSSAATDLIAGTRVELPAAAKRPIAAGMMGSAAARSTFTGESAVVAASATEFAGNTGTGVSAAQARHDALLGASTDKDHQHHVAVNFADPLYYRDTGWNLNNLPFMNKSVLRHVNEEVLLFSLHLHVSSVLTHCSQINGINVPWLYLGMIFSTFCWHNEDHYLYSINYMHMGEGKRYRRSVKEGCLVISATLTAGKTWYGIPGRYAPEFEHAVAVLLRDRVREEHDILYQVRVGAGFFGKYSIAGTVDAAYHNDITRHAACAPRPSVPLISRTR
jgi:hypothetical protein